MATPERNDTSSRLRRVTANRELQKRILYPSLFFVALVAVWTGLVRLWNLPTFLLPTPFEIVASFQGELASLWSHTKITLFEAVFGWVVGNAIGIILGLAMAESKMLRTTLYPYLIAFRSVPAIVIAPLLIIWLGINIQPILAVATIIVFFPTLVNAITGFQSTPQLTEELMRSLDASRWQVIREVKIYHAATYLLSAMKITVALSLIGAIVGEWLVADSGIGFLIVVANNQVNTLLMFRGIIIIGVIGTVWFALVSLAEKYVLYWEEQQGL